MAEWWNKIVSWIKGKPALAANEEPEFEVIQPAEPQKESDSRKPSEKVLDDIFTGYNPTVINEDLQKLESSAHRFRSARESLIQELKKVGSKKKNG